MYADEAPRLTSLWDRVRVTGWPHGSLKSPDGMSKIQRSSESSTNLEMVAMMAQNFQEVCYSYGMSRDSVLQKTKPSSLDLKKIAPKVEVSELITLGDWNIWTISYWLLFEISLITPSLGHEFVAE